MNPLLAMFARIKAVAEKSGIAPRTLARYMAGTSPIPVSKLVDVGSAIGVSAGDIIDHLGEATRDIFSLPGDNAEEDDLEDEE